MPRYTTGYVADDLDGSEYPLLPEISLPEAKPVDTGLVWKTGAPIVRLPNPVGFGRDEEW